MNGFVRTMVALLLMLAWSGAANAQDDFSPENPPEPNQLYDVVVTASPKEAGYVSGTGQYKSGEEVWVNTSLKTDGYKFLYWTKNGDKYSESQDFYYTVEASKAEFVAVYEYKPDSPEEPNSSNEYRLFLAQTPDGCCSFNRDNGQKVEAGSWVEVEAYASMGFQFLGWYLNGIKVSDTSAFNFEMPEATTTLTAKYVFNPTNPGEPESSGGQTNIANGKLGDVNGDNAINIVDVVALVDYCLTGTGSTVAASDINGDGIINIVDVVSLVDKCLNSN